MKSSIRRLLNRETGTLAFPLLIAFLILVFLTGGGSRSDIPSLVILRPVSVLVCAYGLWLLRPDQVRLFRFPLLLLASMLLLAAVHLIPLPQPVWSMLPGRQLVVDIDAASGLEHVWRPISLIPTATWNAFYALYVPLAALLLSIQLDGRERRQLVVVLLILGLASGLIGLLQSIGDPRGPLYFYQITNNGAAVGLFSNRNHQAILLAILFPLLAVFASVGIRSPEHLKARSWMTFAAGVLLVPLLLVTGSRAGLLAGVAGLLSGWWLYRRPVLDRVEKRRGSTFSWRVPLIAFGVLCLGALTVILSRAEAISRLVGSDASEEQRLQIWGPIVDMAWRYFPVGSGVGAFEDVYRIHEPDALLSMSYVYHAHNDWLEMLFTAGLPGILILLVALGWFVRASYTAFIRREKPSADVVTGRLGAIIIALLALGSLGDYPLRVPSLSCLFVVALVWLTAARNAGR